MFASITKIMSLPETTKLYCAHEYTLANIKFAKSAECVIGRSLEREKQKKKRQRDELVIVQSSAVVSLRTTTVRAGNDD